LDLDGGVTQERFVTNYTVLKVGEPLGLFKNFVFEGINQTASPSCQGMMAGWEGIG
jgi:hypothetical protein